MLLRTASRLVLSGTVKRQIRRKTKRVKRKRMQIVHLFCNIRKTNPANPAYRICEIFIYHVRIYPDRLKNLRALIRLNCGNAHLRRNLHNAMQNGVIIVVHRRVIILVKHSGVNQLLNGFLCKIRIDCTRTVPNQRRKIVHLSWLRRFQNQRHTRSLFCAHQVLLHRGNRQKRRNCHMVFVHAPVRKNNNIHTVAVCTVHLYIKMVNCAFQTCVLIINNRNNLYLKTLPLHVFNL